MLTFTGAALLQLLTLASTHRLDEDDACSLLRRLRADHGRGMVNVQAVEAHVAAVVADRAAFVALDTFNPVLLDVVAAD